ncbi:MAG: FAD-dependent oxidoreductase [Proteobacteria bacterium]|nr:FAD-dependent oxidoreductase [Pseudomonadota bacterium]
MSAPVVIVGAGLGGVSVVRELRKLSPDTEITLVTADTGDFYSKPNLSNALAAGRSPAQLRLTPAAQLANELRLNLRPRTRVMRILPGRYRLETDNGDMAYSRLVLALGADPIRLPLQGDGAAAVMAVNHLDDYAAFRLKLEGARRVAILGAGLIGCEFANDLCLAGKQVDVFDLAPQALGRLLPARTAEYFAARLGAAGVRFHFASSVTEVRREGNGYRLSDKDGNESQTDLVLSAVGLKPTLALASAAGLKVQRGIAVADTLATSAANIYALGDCAEVQGLVLPFVLPIMHAARTLAKTLAAPDQVASRLTYPAMPVVVKTPACHAEMSIKPPADADIPPSSSHRSRLAGKRS